MHSLALAVALLFATDDARQFLNLAEEPRDSVIAEWKAGGKDLWVVAGMYEEEMQAAGGELTMTATKGFYDLLVRDRKTKKTTTWRWNGTAYAR